MYETAGYAHMRFQVPLRVYFEQHRMACSAIWHLVELCHENRGLSGARTMVAVENDRCRLFEDHVQGELMALMGVDEAAYSTRNNPISVERGPLRDYAPEAGVQPNDLHSDGALLLYRLHAKAHDEAAEARKKLPDTLRGINQDDWDNMDWANGIKPGQSVLVNGETGLNRVWNAPDLGFRPVMTGRPKGTYSPSPFGGKPGTAGVGEETKEDGSSK